MMKAALSRVFGAASCTQNLPLTHAVVTRSNHKVLSRGYRIVCNPGVFTIGCSSISFHQEHYTDFVIWLPRHACSYRHFHLDVINVTAIWVICLECSMLL